MSLLGSISIQGSNGSLPRVPRLSLTPNSPFVFAGPTKTLVAHDEGSSVEGSLGDSEALIQAAEHKLRASGPNGVLVGAVPFGADTSARLFMPRNLTRYGRWNASPQLVPSTDLPRASILPTANETERSAESFAFVRNVIAATDAMGRGELRKVVLARVKDFALSEKLDTQALLRILRRQNPHGFVFSLGLPASTAEGRTGCALPSRTLIGASPELLLSRRGKLVVSAPLAGSIPRAQDPVEDQARARVLLQSPKDRHEHSFVVDQILENLRPLMSKLSFEPEPTVVSTPAMWHLSTRIEGVLRDLDTSALRLALALHPTPAVCGTPAPAAAAFIRGAETFDRGFFTGTLGYMDASLDGDFIVTIRCAEISDSSVRVFAGAGIVEHSDPEAELREIDAKMQTMLRALMAGSTVGSATGSIQ